MQFLIAFRSWNKCFIEEHEKFTSDGRQVRQKMGRSIHSSGQAEQRTIQVNVKTRSSAKEDIQQLFTQRVFSTR